MKNQPYSQELLAGGDVEATLRRNPHAGAESRDNARCKMFLSHLGILECFRREKTPNLSAVTYSEHPTHWIVGLLWSGYPEPQHNGYRLICLPKSICPEHAMNALVKRFMDDYGGYGEESGKMVRPADWTERN